METINYAEQKILLAQTILALNDVNKISKIQSYVDELLQKKRDTDNEFDAKTLSFLNWNKQFNDGLMLDDFIAEYGMTLRDFRMKIYNSEKQQGMSKETFVEKVNNWK